MGQRGCMLAMLPVAGLVWVAVALSSSVGLLLWWRAVQGVLVGLLMGPAVSYVVEVSHHDIRGSMTGESCYGKSLRGRGLTASF